jgi:hypothetical protein
MTTAALPAAHPDSAVTPAARKVARGLVWLAMASSGIVFAEPAPVDLLFIGLVFFLPAVGLASFSRMLLSYLCLWLLVVAGGFLGSMVAFDLTLACIYRLPPSSLPPSSCAIPCGMCGWS